MPTNAAEPVSVSELNRYVKLLLESDKLLNGVWVEGEISGLTCHNASGHMYFRLTDSFSSVKAVMFKSNADKLRFVVKEGMRVKTRCSVSLYERDGQFQLYVSELFPIGVGSNSVSFNELKAKLEAEGLFSQDIKRELPPVPITVGVITSQNGAALRDIINVLSRRWPFARLVLFPAAVQGTDCPRQVIRAIKRLNSSDEIDLAIIARGGGSAEELSGFNDEGLVRAASELKVPFISAIGHETDYTLLDFVSDRRASTPSVAAEIAVPDAEQYLDGLRFKREYIFERVSSDLDNKTERLKRFKSELKRISLEAVSGREYALGNTARIIESLSPASVMKRGFAGVERESVAVRSSRELRVGERLDVIFSDGRAYCEIKDIDCYEG